MITVPIGFRLFAIANCLYRKQSENIWLSGTDALHQKCRLTTPDRLASRQGSLT